MNFQKIRMMGFDVGVEYRDSEEMADEIRKEDPDFNLRLYGMANIDEKRILLANDSSEQTERSTLLHEVIHMVSGIVCAGLSEDQTEKMEFGLFSVLNDNPDFVAFIAGNVVPKADFDKLKAKFSKVK